MSYGLLRELNRGVASNADISGRESRTFIHVKTPLDQRLPALLNGRQDVVLTGNPGDGKSHVARRLDDLGQVYDAHFEPDLSAISPQELLTRWSAARAAGRPTLLCANEGPLTEVLPLICEHPVLRPSGVELSAQIGRLLVTAEDELPPTPVHAVLIDLADRGVCERQIVESALARVATDPFKPDLPGADDTSPWRNIELLQDEDNRGRLARVFVIAGRACPGHVSFRQLWAAISHSICGGAGPAELRKEIQERRRGSGLWTGPLDLLTDGRERGDLFDAFAFADPCRVAWLELDEALWTSGKPEKKWNNIDMDGDVRPPAALWAEGQRSEALRCFRTLKRLVALANPLGVELIDRMEDAARGPGRAAAGELKKELLDGIRRLFVSRSEEGAAPRWLRDQLPLWVSLSYLEGEKGGGLGDRPFVAAASIPASELEVRRPVRAPWLGDLLGAAPDVVWLHHRSSGVALRVDGPLLAQLRRAANLDGPLSPPERVVRFLSRLSGWEERRHDGSPGPVAMLSAPRGALVCATVSETVEGGGAFAYGASHVG
jgi:hypothetical protein